MLLGMLLDLMQLYNQYLGFTREQAEGCAECLVEIISTTLDHQGRHMVSKPQQVGFFVTIERKE